MMFATQDKQRLYLDSWNYNAALILSELARIVVEYGGRVEPPRHTAIVTNRSIDSAIRDYTAKLNRLAELYKLYGANAARDGEIARLRGEIDRLSSIDNEPVEVPGQNWIHFLLNGKVYSLSLDDNPFFPFYYSKTPLRDDGKYSLDACRYEFDKSWTYDCFLTSKARLVDRHNAANEIFHILSGAKDSRIVRDSRKVRVPNTYDGGYHMETVYDKERLATIDY